MHAYGKTLLTFVTSKNAQSCCVAQRIVSTRLLSTFSRTEVKISVPTTGGHIAAQLWQGTKTSHSPSRTPVICLHGWRDNSGSFDGLIPLIIKDNMTIVSVDFPGHGFSSHTTSAGYDMLYDGVTSIYRIMEHFNWDKISLIGHSYGSVMSFLYIFTNPSQVEKYVAIDFIHVPQEDICKLYRRTFKTLFDVEKQLTNPNIKQPSYTFQEMIQIESKDRHGAMTEEGIKTLLKRGALPDPDNPKLYRFTTDLRTKIPLQFSRVSFDECFKLAEHIQCQVCAIKCIPGLDYFEPRERFIKMVEAIKEAKNEKLEFHLVAGNHHLHLDEPECVAPIISNFLDK